MNDLKSGDWKAQFNSPGGSAYLYIKDNSDQATVIKVKVLLDAQPDSVKQYYRLISKKQLTEGGLTQMLLLRLPEKMMLHLAMPAPASRYILARVVHTDISRIQKIYRQV